MIRLLKLFQASLNTEIETNGCTRVSSLTHTHTTTQHGCVLTSMLQIDSHLTRGNISL